MCVCCRKKVAFCCLTKCRGKFVCPECYEVTGTASRLYESADVLRVHREREHTRTAAHYHSSTELLNNSSSSRQFDGGSFNSQSSYAPAPPLAADAIGPPPPSYAASIRGGSSRHPGGGVYDAVAPIVPHDNYAAAPVALYGAAPLEFQSARCDQP